MDANLCCSSMGPSYKENGFTALRRPEEQTVVSEPSDSEMDDAEQGVLPILRPIFSDHIQLHEKLWSLIPAISSRQTDQGLRQLKAGEMAETIMFPLSQPALLSLLFPSSLSHRPFSRPPIPTSLLFAVIIAAFPPFELLNLGFWKENKGIPQIRLAALTTINRATVTARCRVSRYHSTLGPPTLFHKMTLTSVVATRPNEADGGNVVRAKILNNDQVGFEIETIPDGRSFFVSSEVVRLERWLTTKRNTMTLICYTRTCRRKLHAKRRNLVSWEAEMNA